MEELSDEQRRLRPEDEPATRRPAPAPGPGRSAPSRRRQRRLPRGTVGTVVKLALACFAVGVVLTLLSIDPVAFWRGAFDAVAESARDLYDFGLGGVGLVLAIMATGAIIVLPIWGLKKLIGLLKR